MKSPRLLFGSAGKFAAGYLILLALAVAGQSLTHVYRSDLNWADEGSHYVSGLMVHDYIADGVPGNPIGYAARYYTHFPKVGIGHWPPLYYVIEAAWFFLTGPGIRTALFLEAVFAAGVAAIVGAVVGRLGGRSFGWIAAVAASLATLAAPEMFLGMQGNMLDVPLAFVALLAMLAWARFLFDEDWRWPVGFGLAASAAIMIKGNGIALALVPPLSIALSNRFRLLRDWRFWLPAPIVAVLTVPWYLLTYKITAEGFNYHWGFHYVALAAPAYGWSVVGEIGIVGLLLAMLGALAALRLREWCWRRALAGSALGFVIAGFLFHSVVPADIDGRYLTPLAPALVILAYLGVERLVASRTPPARALLMAACFLAVIAVESRFHDKATRAMNDAAELIFAAPHPGQFMLVGSTPGGEGAFTAQAATLDRKRASYVVRGFEVLGSGNFNGTNYAPRFGSPEQLAQWIEGHGIGWVVIDVSPQSLSWAHNGQLQKIAESGRQGWTLAGSFPSSFGHTLVYRVSPPAGQTIDHAGLLSELAPRNVIGQHVDP
jgi:Dolichyl-phosphate-mannose-protein mannosyltransferase